MIDYPPAHCDTLADATVALTMESTLTIMFNVYDKQTETEVPKGSIVRFNKKKRVVQTWTWDEDAGRYLDEIKYSAINVAVAS